MKVRIKTWEELLATPGVVLIDDSISIPGQDDFVQDMRYLCGTTMEFSGPNTRLDDWNIYPWMVTEIKSHNFKVIYDILNEE